MDLFGRKRIAVLERRLAVTQEQLEEFMGALADMTLQARRWELESNANIERAVYWAARAKEAAEAPSKLAAENLARLKALSEDDDEEQAAPVDHTVGLYKRLNEIFGDGLTPEEMARRAEAALPQQKDMNG
jgi:uncharacterized protein YgbK (DUF1537 family)